MRDKPQAPSSFQSPPDAAASWNESRLHAVNAPLSEQPRHGYASIAHINFEDLGVLQVLKDIFVSTYYRGGKPCFDFEITWHCSGVVWRRDLLFNWGASFPGLAGELAALTYTFNLPLPRSPHPWPTLVVSLYCS
jgi:hypothetical protein